ncbi:hypothetical protein GZH47_13495 [Paenibacillus rhizovicinus]|uniref:Uncharacterized protein n=1 Tax=Paenibacillus rhizovicinus TaxID=2704463 RepID=A0A6C0P510_9BACL|nr:hypothetical protein [Paenibacillus rhizovicinus]QHW31752.1 hypothetical protein GZH47_13495 [Paenibacillus rhizovicinus]
MNPSKELHPVQYIGGKAVNSSKELHPVQYIGGKAVNSSKELHPVQYWRKSGEFEQGAAPSAVLEEKR